MSGLAPVRPCCGQRHFGVVCPNGRVMCCLCFGLFSQDELHVLPDGTVENVCQECFEHEETGVDPDDILW